MCCVVLLCASVGVQVQNIRRFLEQHKSAELPRKVEIWCFSQVHPWKRKKKCRNFKMMVTLVSSSDSHWMLHQSFCLFARNKLHKKKEGYNTTTSNPMKALCWTVITWSRLEKFISVLELFSQADCLSPNVKLFPPSFWIINQAQVATHCTTFHYSSKLWQKNVFFSLWFVENKWAEWDESCRGADMQRCSNSSLFRASTGTPFLTRVTKATGG